MLAQFQRVALARAFRSGSSRGWLIAGTAVWLLRKANDVRRPEAETVFRGVLEPGQRLVIEDLGIDRTGKPATRKAKRAAKKARR